MKIVPVAVVVVASQLAGTAAAQVAVAAGASTPVALVAGVVVNIGVAYLLIGALK